MSTYRLLSLLTHQPILNKLTISLLQRLLRDANFRRHIRRRNLHSHLNTNQARNNTNPLSGGNRLLVKDSRRHNILLSRITALNPTTSSRQLRNQVDRNIPTRTRTRITKQDHFRYNNHLVRARLLRNHAKRGTLTAGSPIANRSRNRPNRIIKNKRRTSNHRSIKSLRKLSLPTLSSKHRRPKFKYQDQVRQVLRHRQPRSILQRMIIRHRADSTLRRRADRHRTIITMRIRHTQHHLRS